MILKLVSLILLLKPYLVTPRPQYAAFFGLPCPGTQSCAVPSAKASSSGVVSASCPLPFLNPCSSYLQPCTPPCPQLCPQLCPQPYPQPNPQPCPQPCPQPYPQPCPQPYPQPCPQPYPQPSPQPSPQPCPPPSPPCEWSNPGYNPCRNQPCQQNWDNQFGTSTSYQQPPVLVIKCEKSCQCEPQPCQYPNSYPITSSGPTPTQYPPPYYPTHQYPNPYDPNDYGSRMTPPPITPLNNNDDEKVIPEGSVNLKIVDAPNSSKPKFFSSLFSIPGVIADTLLSGEVSI